MQAQSPTIIPSVYSPTTYTPATYTATSALTKPSYYPSFSHPLDQNPVEPPRPPSPPQPAVTPQVASQTIQRLVSSEFRDAGFEGTQPSALYRLEQEVVSFVQQLYQRAHAYANLSNRSTPIATDLLLAAEEFGLSLNELRSVKTKIAKKRRSASIEPVRAPDLVTPESRPASPDQLPSDDESVPQTVPSTLRALPAHFPSLPPKHTYLQTPASPPKKAAIPSLEKKLKTASLVQDSLKNLLLATEDSSNQGDAELLGHIVNWETSIHPRKRWKFGP
ncbi:hypothetical protein K435DRAFT_647185 [Dendrothele bispora CBS 962.96]|uniref:Transcription initiation factor TFIID subunit 8 n=1 Tax=Dendrothele bispora (strain CBS 962.96) TaxID=1314807 RepID=A0A4S8MQZ7_DENBC|nr:hypothetical protein K435DRAFT_647185 [Dendrothele bispora CBS 962.96]